ncbi:hypothetical protein [Candidatus Lokiarchaeum ossiferum]
MNLVQIMLSSKIYRTIVTYLYINVVFTYIISGREKIGQKTCR